MVWYFLPYDLIQVTIDVMMENRNWEALRIIESKMPEMKTDIRIQLASKMKENFDIDWRDVQHMHESISFLYQCLIQPQSNFDPWFLGNDELIFITGPPKCGKKVLAESLQIQFQCQHILVSLNPEDGKEFEIIFSFWDQIPFHAKVSIGEKKYLYRASKHKIFTC